MREIKFRAWDKENGCWASIDSVALCDDGSVAYLLSADGEPPYLEEDVEIMQYTGLKDVNGKPIYEGDVVSFGSVWDNGDNEDLDEEIHIGVVEYDPHYTVYNVNCEESGERRFLLMDVVNYDGFGVIGNIYESPELLEVRDEL